MVTDDDLLALLCYARYVPADKRAALDAAIGKAIDAGARAVELPTQAVADFGRAVAGDLTRHKPAASKKSLPPCAYRGSLITRAPCGCDERNAYQCAAPALMIDGKPAPIIGAICQTCKYRAAPKK